MDKFREYLDNLSLDINREKISEESLYMFESLLKPALEKMIEITNERMDKISSNVEKQISEKNLSLVTGIVKYNDLKKIENSFYSIVDYYDNIDFSHSENNRIIFIQSVEDIKVYFFADMNYEEYIKLNGQVYNGTLITESNEEIATEFILSTSDIVKRKTDDFKKFYLKNRLKDLDLFAPFTERMFVLELKNKIKNKKIKQIFIENIASDIHFDYIPVWNVKNVNGNNSNSPVEKVRPYKTQNYIVYYVNIKSSNEYNDVIVEIPENSDIEYSDFNVDTGKIEIVTHSDEYFSLSWNLYAIKKITEINKDSRDSYFINKFEKNNEKDFYSVYNKNIIYGIPSEIQISGLIHSYYDIVKIIVKNISANNNNIVLYLDTSKCGIYKKECIQYILNHVQHSFPNCIFEIKE